MALALLKVEASSSAMRAVSTAIRSVVFMGRREPGGTLQHGERRRSWCGVLDVPPHHVLEMEESAGKR